MAATCPDALLDQRVLTAQQPVAIEERVPVRGRSHRILSADQFRASAALREVVPEIVPVSSQTRAPRGNKSQIVLAMM
jgi:hypothetical protein